MKETVMDMEFTVDLQPAEYAQAMRWHQFGSTWQRRLNDWIAWSILVLTPITVGLLLWLNALSIWFWPVAIVAVLYSLYSSVYLRHQLSRQAEAILAAHPALAQTQYRVHAKGIHLQSQVGDEAKLFVPWKRIAHVQELPDLYLIFVAPDHSAPPEESDQPDPDAAQMLVLPKRTLPDLEAFRARLPIH
jgi:hypothetical protein